MATETITVRQRTGVDGNLVNISLFIKAPTPEVIGADGMGNLELYISADVWERIKLGEGKPIDLGV